MPEGRAVRRWLCALVILALSTAGLQAQQPSREYIRLGGRVIAVENYEAISVAISPSSTTIAAGGQVQFTATVSGTTNTAVTWSVEGGGMISASGLYTAPTGISSPLTATVTATSQADTSKTAIGTLIVNPGLSVTVSPSSTTISAGAQLQFTAAVSGTTNSAVTWSVQGGGTISASGLYTAPTGISSPLTATITATSQADTSKSGTSMVVVNPVVSVAVSPSSTTVGAGAQVQFTAIVSGTTNTSVSWSAQGGGTINTLGLYSAPTGITSPLTVTVRATSQADTSKSGTATVIVNPVVSVMISPSSTTLVEGWETQLTATVTGDTGQGVTWSLSPAGRGTLTSNGLSVTYRTPTDVASVETVTVTATSNAYPSAYASATITINPNRPPALVSASPNSGTGSRRAFTFTVSDPDGNADIRDMQLMLDWDFSSRCHLYFNGNDAVILETDTGGWSAGVSLGTSQSATNSNCTVYGAGSSVARAGNNLSLTVDLGFKSQFSGMKHLYLVASDKVGTVVGWNAMGTWLVPGVPGTSQAAVVSMSTVNEVFAGQSFTATVRMRNSGQNYWQSSSINPQQPHRLGSQNPQDNGRWGFGRVDMSGEVPPSAETTFQFNATAPTSPGTYPFDWRMVHDAVEWFGGTATKTITVRSTNPYPESPHPYSNYLGQTWTYTLAGSPSTINVTFDSRTSVEPGYDYIYVMDGSGVQVPGSPFTGDALAGQTLTVPGSTVQIRLTSNSSITAWGFSVTSVAAGPNVPTAGFYDDPDSSITYSGGWYTDYQFTEPIGATITYTANAGATAEFTFLGTGVTYHFTKAFNRGYADVYIDGSFKRRIDLYSSGIEWRSSSAFSGLTYSIHTIRIVVTGQKRAESQGAAVDVDGFTVVDPY